MRNNTPQLNTTTTTTSTNTTSSKPLIGNKSGSTEANDWNSQGRKSLEYPAVPESNYDGLPDSNIIVSGNEKNAVIDEHVMKTIDDLIEDPSESNNSMIY